MNYENFVEFAAALRPEIEANRKNIATKQLTAVRPLPPAVIMQTLTST